MDDVMNGQVLKLQSEILMEQGYKQGREEAYFEMVQEGFCPIDLAAKKLQMPDAEFEKRMEAAGYRIPEPV